MRRSLCTTQAVVLAAGRGTRLGDLTTDRSKAMLPVVGKPLVGRVLERLWAAGLRHFVVVGGPVDVELAAYCRDKEAQLLSERGSLSYVIQDEQRGTAHALACAASSIEHEFVLSACDNLVGSDFVVRLVTCLKGIGADGIMALLRMSPEQLQHSGAVERTAGNRVRRIIEKPPPGSTASDAGSIPLYAFEPRLLDYLDVPVSSRGERELQSAIQALIEAGGDVRGLFAPGRRTVTDAEDLLALNLHYLDQRRDTALQTALPADVTVSPPVRIERGTEIGPGCTIGPRVYLESGSRVGKGVVLRDAVVLRGTVVPDGAEVVGRLRGP